MLRNSIIACAIGFTLSVYVHASSIEFLDQFDDPQIVNSVINDDLVKASRKELQKFADQLLNFNKKELYALLGKATEKPAKAYAMPVAEARTICIGGARASNDNRPNEDFISFHTVGDYAAVEIYYIRDDAADKPYAIRFYLKADKTFPKLAKDNLKKRLAWEQERLTRLAEHIGKSKQK